VRGARPPGPGYRTGLPARGLPGPARHGPACRPDPPSDFWAAAAAHATPSDQAALATAAHDRGLYRDAAQLHKNAAGAYRKDGQGMRICRWDFLISRANCVGAQAVADRRIDDPIFQLCDGVSSGCW